MRWVLLVAVLGGCFDPSFSDATHCSAGRECPTGRTCVGQVCLPVNGNGGHTPYPEAWTGAATVTTTEANGAASCGGWASGAGTGIVGALGADPTGWWNTGVPRACNADLYPVYCVQD